MRTVPGDILYHKAFKLVQAGQWRYSSMRIAPGYVYTDVQTFKTVLLTVPELWFFIFRAWLYPMTGGTRTAALLHVPCYYPWKGGARSAALYPVPYIIPWRGGTRTPATQFFVKCLLSS